MLLAGRINTEAFEVNVAARSKLWLDRPRDVDGRLHAELLHAVLQDSEFDGNNTGYLNSTTE